MLIGGKIGDLADVVSTWICRYDGEEKCEPFEFELAWP
jgi:hypothetical protein